MGVHSDFHLVPCPSDAVVPMSVAVPDGMMPTPEVRYAPTLQLANSGIVPNKPNKIAVKIPVNIRMPFAIGVCRCECAMGGWKGREEEGN